MKLLKILLVDDDEIQRIKFKKVCKKINCDIAVFEAVNGKNALTFLNDKNNSFDLIVSDLNMPQMNGLELLKSIKNSSKHYNIPLVIMSTSNDKFDLKNCYKFGVSGFFSKPTKFSEYSKKVISLIEYWRISETVC